MVDDHIVVLEPGRVIDQGTHEELLARCALYQKLWRSHTASLEWSLELGAATAIGAEVA